MRFEDYRRIRLFAGTPDDQLRALVGASTEVPFEHGDLLWQENEPADHWWVLLEGTVELLRHVGTEAKRLGAMDMPGQWAGGFRAWDDQGRYLATGRGGSTGCALAVPTAALRELWDAHFPLGVRVVEGIYNTLRNYEAMARQKESLAALGTLAAGLAHELNNPAAAATRAVDALAEANAGVLSSLQELVAVPIGADQFAELDTLRRQLGPGSPASPHPPGSPAPAPCPPGSQRWPRRSGARPAPGRRPPPGERCR